MTDLPVVSWESAYRGRTVAVTGAGGYLAAALLNRLSPVAGRILAVQRRAPAGVGAARSGVVQTIVGDVRDSAVWERLAADAEVIFHLAAQTSAYTANADPAADFELNARPILHLGEACRRLTVAPRLVFAGTVTIFGFVDRLPVDEDAPDRPMTMYEVHKLLSEQYLRYYSVEGLLRGVSLRLPNVYGPGPRVSSADRGVLNLMIQRAIAGQPLRVFGDGAFVRDYIFIDDVADAFLAAGMGSAEVSGRHFVLGTGVGTTIREAAALVADCAERVRGRRPPIEHVPPPDTQLAIERRNFVGDASRFHAATGWRALVPLARGIDRTFEHYLKEVHATL